MITRNKNRLNAAQRMEPHLHEVFEPVHMALIASFSSNSFSCLSRLSVVSRATHDGSAKAWKCLIEDKDNVPTIETVLDTERLLRLDQLKPDLRKNRGGRAVLKVGAKEKKEVMKERRMESLEKASGLSLLHLKVSRECYMCLTVTRLPHFFVDTCAICEESIPSWLCSNCDSLNMIREKGDHDGKEAFLCSSGCVVFHFTCKGRRHYCKVADFDEGGIFEEFGCGKCRECCTCESRCRLCNREFDGVEVTPCPGCGTCLQCH